MEIIPFKLIHKRQVFLYIDSTRILLYNKGKLQWYVDNEFIFSIDVPMKGFKKFFSKFRLFERLLRLAPRCLVNLDNNNFLISYSGKILNLDVSKQLLKIEHCFRNEMRNPLKFTKIKGIKNFKDSVVYGEYFMNPDEKDVHIWQRDENGEWKVVYTFKNNITHVHNIVPDPKRGCVYILTGDFDSGSAIWLATDNFSKVVKLLSGKQIYRSCAAFPVDDGLIYATDTPLEKNFLFHVKLTDYSVVSLKKICDMPGACINATHKNKKYFFSTSVEPDSTLPTWRYFFTYKLGRGIIDRCVHLICYDGENSIDIKQFPKDIYPMTLFQFGDISFPICDIERCVCLQPTALKHIDSRPLLLKF